MRLTIILCCLIFSDYSITDDFFLVQPIKPVEAHFLQTKLLAGVSFDIKSKGITVFIPRVGVIHKTHTPINKTEVYGTEGISLFDAEDLLKHNNALNNKIDKSVSEILVALLNGQNDKVKKWFKTDETINKNLKVVKLLPKKNVIKKALDYVEIEYDVFINRITIVARSGDITSIQFYDYKPLSKTKIQSVCSHYFSNQACP